MSEPPNRRDDAACTHADPDLFFPIGTTGAAATQIHEAKQICHGCPARLPCLARARGVNCEYAGRSAAGGHRWPRGLEKGRSGAGRQA